MSFCSQCGAELNSAEKFCHKCGHHVEDDSPEKGDQPGPVPTSSERPVPAVPGASADSAASIPATQKAGGLNINKGCLKIGLIVLGSFLAVVFLIIIALVSMTSGPVDTVEAHIAALKAGSMDVAFEHTSVDFRANTNKDQYRQFILNYPILRTVADTSFPERSVENNTGSVKGNLIVEDGSKFPVAVSLVKESGEWKILAIDFSSLPTGADASNAAPSESVQPGTAESSIGKIVMGAGRQSDGSLINPGEPIPTRGGGLAADIEMINHPIGEKVEVWIVHPKSGIGSPPVEAAIQGAGSGTFTYDLTEIPGDGLPVGKWIIYVRLAGTKEFEHEFIVR